MKTVTCRSRFIRRLLKVVPSSPQIQKSRTKRKTQNLQQSCNLSKRPDLVVSGLTALSKIIVKTGLRRLFRKS